jgi:hypothetical protein
MDAEGTSRMTLLLCRGTGLTALQRFVRLPHNPTDLRCLLYILTVIHIICTNYFARKVSYSLSAKRTIERDSAFQVTQLSKCIVGKEQTRYGSYAGKHTDFHLKPCKGSRTET